MAIFFFVGLFQSSFCLFDPFFFFLVCQLCIFIWDKKLKSGPFVTYGMSQHFAERDLNNSDNLRITDKMFRSPVERRKNRINNRQNLKSQITKKRTKLKTCIAENHKCGKKTTCLVCLFLCNAPISKWARNRKTRELPCEWDGYRQLSRLDFAWDVAGTRAGRGCRCQSLANPYTVWKELTFTSVFHLTSPPPF